MNPFLNLLFLSLFIVAITYFIINVEEDDYIKNKFLLFISIFFFQFVLIIISKIINNCKINIFNIANDSLRIALVGVIGLSIYTDLTLMDNTKYLFEPDVLNHHKSKWMCTTIIILFISVVKIIELLLNSSQYGCLE